MSPPDVAVLSGGLALDVIAHGGSATAVVWPGMGSESRSVHRIALEPGGATVLFRHDGEAVYCVAHGSGSAGGVPIRAHSMIYVPPHTPYRIEADANGDQGVLAYGGPCPPDLALYDGAEPTPKLEGRVGRVMVLDPSRDGVPLPMIGKQVRLVVWPGMGAKVATMNFAILERGEENEPHTHESSDDVIAVFEGAGSIDNLSSGETHEFGAGDVVFVRAGVHHKVKADRGLPLTSAGGPCPPDYQMLNRVRFEAGSPSAH